MDFTLRPWRKDDVDDLYKFANNIDIARNLTNKFTYPYSMEKAAWFIDFATKDSPIHIFAIDIDGRACGSIGIHPQDDIFCKNAELGYWLGEPYWNKGIITEAVKQVVEIGFNLYNINRIFARPFGSNIASQKVLEKAGFIFEARFEKTIFKLGKYEDELVYAVRR